MKTQLTRMFDTVGCKITDIVYAGEGFCLHLDDNKFAVFQACGCEQVELSTESPSLRQLKIYKLISESEYKGAINAQAAD